ncbi:MAG: polysaccharide biosynthesis C-terminal domain-containing protein [Lachnospiraceae bacterium]|nr:polysaccharide biosynthesis C-terminal domain-containing protein [Lachnospiraceae bacterium]
MSKDASVLISENMSLKELIKTVAPGAIIYLVIALYAVIDSLLIDIFINETAIAATSVFLPVVSLFVGLGYMAGTGGNAAIMKAQGENDHKKAQDLHSQLMTCAIFLGISIPLIFFILQNPVMKLLGMTGDNAVYVTGYYRVSVCFMPVLLFSCVINLMLIGEGRLGLVAVLELAGGLTNCILDIIFMGFLNTGIAGAALATGLGYLLQTLTAFVMVKKTSVYDLKPVRIDIKEMSAVFFNGISEFLSSISTAVVTVILNNVSGKYWGAVGMSVVCVITNIIYMVSFVFMGFLVALEPLIAYFYGQKNRKELKSLISKSLKIVGCSSIIITLSVTAFRKNISASFFEVDSKYYSIAVKGFLLAAGVYAFTGFNMFVSGLFTAYSNGRVSGFFSLMRSLVIYALMILILSKIFGGDGMWIAMSATEILSAILGIYLIRTRLRV